MNLLFINGQKLYTIVCMQLILVKLITCGLSFCHMQGVARHWRNPVRTRVTPLDSSDALYNVYLAYAV